MNPNYDYSNDVLEQPGIVYIVDDELEIRDSLK